MPNYVCETGRVCHASCRATLLLEDDTALQSFLFDGVAQYSDNVVDAFWPCSGREQRAAPHIFPVAPKYA